LAKINVAIGVYQLFPDDQNKKYYLFSVYGLIIFIRIALELVFKYNPKCFVTLLCLKKKIVTDSIVARESLEQGFI
jgi:hypothetical protein